AHRLRAGKKQVTSMVQTTVKPARPDWPAAWSGARERLKRELGDAVFDAWIGPLTLDGWENDELNIGAVRPFVRNWVSNHYVARIERALKSEGAEPASISIVLTIPKPVIGGGIVREPARIEPPVASYAVRTGDDDAAKDVSRGLWTRMLHPQQTFDSFVCGPSNEFALGAARSFAEGANSDIPLLYIHGGSATARPICSTPRRWNSANAAGAHCSCEQKISCATSWARSIARIRSPSRRSCAPARCSSSTICSTSAVRRRRRPNFSTR